MSDSTVVNNWLLEVVSSLDPKHVDFSVLKLKSESLYKYTPTQPAHEVSRKISEELRKDKRKFVRLMASDRTVLLDYQPDGRNHASTIVCFGKPCEFFGIFEKNQYVARLIAAAQAAPFSANSKGEVRASAPSTGRIPPKLDGLRKRIAICTPVYKRVKVLACFLRFMQTYFIPHMRLNGFDAYLILAGGSEEAVAVSPLLDDKTLYLNVPNILGYKKNVMFDAARAMGADAAVTIDSDDFLHPELVRDLIHKAFDNGHWASVEKCCFIDAKSNAYGIFEGYAPSHSLHKWGLGSGRVFTKQVLSTIGKSPYSIVKNKSMDSFIRECLRAIDLKSEDRLIESPKYLPLALKTEQNIWSFEGYDLRIVERIRTPEADWLPSDILRELSSIPFEVEG